MQRKTNDAAALLKIAGLRVTGQRVALLRELRRATRPRSAETLANALRGALDLVTVYRNLEQFAAAGIARRVELGGASALYESADDHHHHLVCTSCGKVEDVEACVAPLAKRTLTNASFASVRAHSLEFFGTCTACV